MGYLVELDRESIIHLYYYWIDQRDYANKCRWTQSHITKDTGRYKVFDEEYKRCDKNVRNLRKIKKQMEKEEE